MALIRLPGLEMVAGRQETKAGLRCRCADLDEFRDRELLVSQHVTDQALLQPAIAGLGSESRRSFQVRCRHGMAYRVCRAVTLRIANRTPPPPAGSRANASVRRTGSGGQNRERPPAQAKEKSPPRRSASVLVESWSPRCRQDRR